MECSPTLSDRVCKPCGRKIRTAYEHFNFIKAGLNNKKRGDGLTDVQTQSSPQRYKRTLPSNICSPDRSPQVKKSLKHAATRAIQAKKSLGFQNCDNVLNELNIEELVEKDTAQLKVIVVYPSGLVQSKSTFDDVTKSLIINLVQGKWKTAANFVFKHAHLRSELADPLTKVVGEEFKEYCSDSFDSILKRKDPVDLAAFSNKLLVHEVELQCPFWMSCLQGACNVPSSNIDFKTINAMALSTSIAARCRNHKMSAVAYRVSAVLFHSGTRFNDLERLHKLGICMSPDSIVGMEKRMGEHCEAKLNVWKKNIEKVVACQQLLMEVREKQVGLCEPNDMQLDLVIDFTEDNIKPYQYYEKSNFDDCNSLLNGSHSGPDITDEELESVLQQIHDVPSYK